MEYIVVACSGGPDSMALLDRLYKAGKNIVVAHVNYQKRNSAFRDEKIVVNYCSRRNIACEILKPVQDHKSNFQSWARKVRYDFFFSVAEKYGAKDVYTAHHMDDHIETYLFQKQRNMLCDHYGLNTETKMHSFIIQRPLLGYTKQELYDYCVFNQLDFGIDESNLTDDYTRNKIRHSLLDKMDRKDKLAVLVQIQKDNENLLKLRSQANLFIKSWECDIDSLIAQKNSWFILEYFLSQKTGKHYAKKHILSVIEQIKKDCLIDFGDYELESFHKVLYLEKKDNRPPIVLDKIIYRDFEQFGLKSTGQVIEGVNVSNDELPLKIRTVKKGDQISLRYGSKKLARFFIDRKIPRIYRKKWLVVENNQEKVIFVPGIGCDVEHFSIKPNLFMVQYLS